MEATAPYCEELQAILNQELATSDLVHSLFEDFALTRRRALLLLASLSAGLITAVGEEPTSHKLLGEFLPQCAASLTACHLLMQGSDFSNVEKALKQYMPVLEYVAQKPSLYQLAAARLAAQGRMLCAILAWHRLDVPGCTGQHTFSQMLTSTQPKKSSNSINPCGMRCGRKQVPLSHFSR